MYRDLLCWENNRDPKAESEHDSHVQVVVSSPGFSGMQWSEWLRYWDWDWGCVQCTLTKWPVSWWVLQRAVKYVLWQWQTSFLSIWFVTGLGMILYCSGDMIRQYNEDEIDNAPPDWFNLEFVGAFMATLFWVSRNICNMCVLLRISIHLFTTSFSCT